MSRHVPAVPLLPRMAFTPADGIQDGLHLSQFYINSNEGVNMPRRKYDKEQQQRYYKLRMKWKKIKDKVTPVVFAWDRYQCRNCGTVANLTVDHIVPLSKDGTNKLDNLQTLCLSCNCTKGVY